MVVYGELWPPQIVGWSRMIAGPAPPIICQAGLIQTFKTLMQTSLYHTEAIIMYQVPTTQFQKALPEGQNLSGVKMGSIRGPTAENVWPPLQHAQVQQQPRQRCMQPVTMISGCIWMESWVSSTWTGRRLHLLLFQREPKSLGSHVMIMVEDGELWPPQIVGWSRMIAGPAPPIMCQAGLIQTFKTLMETSLHHGEALILYQVPTTQFQKALLEGQNLSGVKVGSMPSAENVWSDSCCRPAPMDCYLKCVFFHYL